MFSINKDVKHCCEAHSLVVNKSLIDNQLLSLIQLTSTSEHVFDKHRKRQSESRQNNCFNLFSYNKL